MDNKFKYCYLTHCYSDNAGELEAFELVTADEYFEHVLYFIANKENLLKIRKSDALFNFAIDNGNIRCNNIKCSTLNNLIKANMNTWIQQSSIDNLYTLLGEGLKKRFYFVADEYAVPYENIDEFGSTEFCNLKFSKSTMSVYFSSFDQDGLKNKMIIKMQDNKLKFQPFFFAVPKIEPFSQPENKELIVQRCGDITLNSEEAILYRVEQAPFVEECIVEHALINKASIIVAKSNNLCSFLDSYRELICTKVLGKENLPVAWAGGNHSYSSPYGVYYRADIKDLTKSCKNELLDLTLNKVVPKFFSQKDFKGAVTFINGLNLPYLSRIAVICLANIIFQSSGLEDSILTVNNVIRDYKLQGIFANLYLYKVRSLAYTKQRYYAEAFTPIIGSDEPFVTLAQEEFPYDS